MTKKPRNANALAEYAPEEATRFEISIGDAGQRYEVSGNFMTSTLFAFYFSLLTSFQSRSASFVIDKVGWEIRKGDDDGGYVSEDYAQNFGPISRIVLSDLLKVLGKFMAGITISVPSENTRSAMLFRDVFDYTKTLVPNDALTIETFGEGKPRLFTLDVKKLAHVAELHDLDAHAVREVESSVLLEKNADFDGDVISMDGKPVVVVPESRVEVDSDDDINVA